MRIDNSWAGDGQAKRSQAGEQPSPRDPAPRPGSLTLTPRRPLPGHLGPLATSRGLPTDLPAPSGPNGDAERGGIGANERARFKFGFCTLATQRTPFKSMQIAVPLPSGRVDPGSASLSRTAGEGRKRLLVDIVK